METRVTSPKTDHNHDVLINKKHNYLENGKKSRFLKDGHNVCKTIQNKSGEIYATYKAGFKK